MQKGQQLVTIKGTKEGLIFYLDDSHLFEAVYEELQKVLTSNPFHQNPQKVSVIIHLGYRYLKEHQKKELRKLIEQDQRFHVEKFSSEVMNKQEVEILLDKNEVKPFYRIVRSGQILEITGHLLLIGDVNPGGEVRATGDIYIMGKLHGVAHAGVNGDENAVIIASYMNPNQLRIANYISRAPDYESDGVYMECGYFNKEDGKIKIDRLQAMPQIRKELHRLERGILNG